jgi:hypothetical protein
MYRLRFAAPLILVALLTSGFLPGQDRKGDPEPIVITKKLPANYSKLGLTDKQKREIYKRRAAYSLKIEELQQKITALRAQEKAELENILTEAQKARLRELQSGAAGKEKNEVPAGGSGKDKSGEIKKP